MDLRLAGIVRESIVDGPGIRFTIFCQGCPHNCEGCHNMQTHDFNGGTMTSQEKILNAIDENPLLQGVTFSGGEPFSQADALAELAVKLKERNLNIYSYSGWTFEQLMEKAKKEEGVRKLLENIDVLIDGPFILKERDLSLLFRGSRNQRLIDVPQSLEKGQAVEKIL
ncbi:MAG: anaerobic ribonucleoside-triphosphate reductase activating protein [Clostridia bacterium]|nr:anaerobic ribonucleoside-triphosphate reductase activating protein [Clostridia bacterium]